MARVDLSQFDGAIIAGITFDEIPPGTIDGECGGCGNTIKIGPKSQAVMAEHPDMEFATLCMACVIRQRVTQGRNMEVSVFRAKDALIQPE